MDARVVGLNGFMNDGDVGLMGLIGWRSGILGCMRPWMVRDQSDNV